MVSERERQPNRAGEDTFREPRIGHRLVVAVTFWNDWIRPHIEHYADGSSAVFFGFGKLAWRHKQVVR